MNVAAIYAGSNGDETKALYALLQTRGVRGAVAMNLFRAQKCSARAKVYRGGIPGRGSYSGMAYERKDWSLRELVKILTAHAGELDLRWGWQEDTAQVYHRWVLYVDLPSGQVSFHTAGRGDGPEYPGRWDGVRDVSPTRIIQWCEAVLADRDAPLLQPAD